MSSNSIYIDLIKSMCIDNKYTKWYINICTNAINRFPETSKSKRVQRKIAVKELGYVEAHHILPRCISTEFQIKDKFNNCFLTPKAHFVCHRLLAKMFTGNIKYKMMSAMAMFLRDKTGNRKLSSNQIAAARETTSKITSIRTLLRLAEYGHHMQGKHHSEETKNKISNSLIGTVQSEESRNKRNNTIAILRLLPDYIPPNFGIKHDDEYKLMMSNACKNSDKVVNKTVEHNTKNSIANTGRVHLANVITKARIRPKLEEALKLLNDYPNEWMKLATMKPIPDKVP